MISYSDDLKVKNIMEDFVFEKIDKIVDSLNNYIMKNDRVQKFELEGKHAMLLTSKHENSISYILPFGNLISSNIFLLYSLFQTGKSETILCIPSYK